MEKNVCRVKE
jgi:hypothetical protein